MKRLPGINRIMGRNRPEHANSQLCLPPTPLVQRKKTGSSWSNYQKHSMVIIYKTHDALTGNRLFSALGS